MVIKKVIFLDRDGVINKKPPKADYVKKWDEFIFLKGAIKGLQFLTKQNYDIFIITNQAGIARNSMTEKDLKDLHTHFLTYCKKQGIAIKQIYYCPHGWNDGCLCRKPKPGMLLQSAKDHHFFLKNAVFIGDDDRDIAAGKAAGCKTVLMPSNGNLYDVLRDCILT